MLNGTLTFPNYPRRREFYLTILACDTLEIVHMSKISNLAKQSVKNNLASTVNILLAVILVIGLCPTFGTADTIAREDKATAALDGNTSRYVLVVSDDENALSREPVISEYGNTYLLEYKNPSQAADALEKLSDDEGKVSTIYIKVDKGADVEAVEKRIDDKYGDNLTTISSLSDLDMVKNMIDMLNGASLAISILAVVIGAVGIINTMLTSVYERTRELGVLKAVGWSDGKILLMIIGESIVITIVAGIIGSIAGIIGVELIVLSNIMPLLTPVYTVNIFVQAFSIALFVGVIGGIYPALKAVKLPPTEALRYE